MIVYCTMANPARIEELKTALSIMKPGVDRMVVVCNNSGKTNRWTSVQLSELTALGAETYEREWNGNFPDARNEYLNKCQTDDWMIISDSDEHFCPLFVKELNWILEQMEKKKKKRAVINAHDITAPLGWVEGDNAPTELKSGHYKQLIFRKTPDMKYIGVGVSRTVHEHLIPVETEVMKLNDNYYYVHRKTEEEVIERAARNFVTGGGGNNKGRENPAWLPFLDLTKAIGYDNWYDLKDYLIAGKIDQSIKDFMFVHRTNGFDYEEEMMQLFRYYFEILHPEECPKGIAAIRTVPKESLAGIYKIVESVYMEYLGRHPSDEDKKNYADKMFAKELTEEALRNIFLTNPEYIQLKQRELLESSEKIDVSVKIMQPQVLMTPAVMNQILKHSAYYNNHLRSYTAFGRKWEIMTAINRKIESQGQGTDKQPLESFDHYIAICKKWLPANKYLKMLDIGCGAGDETQAFINAGFEPLGITIGPDNVQYAHDTYNLAIHEIDMVNLPFPESFFDSAVCIHTFEHCYAPDVFIGELYFTLRSGGRIFLIVPSAEEEAMEMVWHINLLLPWQIIKKFAMWGFKVLWQDKYSFVFEKLPPDHKDFTNWGYLHHVYEQRRLIK